MIRLLSRVAVPVLTFPRSIRLGVTRGVGSEVFVLNVWLEFYLNP